MSVFQAASPELAAMLKATASSDPVIRTKAVTQFYDTLGPLIRDGVMVGDITADIFTEVNLPSGVTPEFRLSPIRPGTENEYRAYTNPGMGHIPERAFFGDRIILPTIDVSNSQSWPLKYARDARWDVVSKGIEVFMAGFVYKKNDDCWHTILKAAADRGMTIYDAAASAGQFTKRLFSQIDIAMKRNGGGNSASIRRGKATNLYVSPEAIQEVLNWNIDQIPDVVRAQFYQMAGQEKPVMDILGVKLHELYELGAGQSYQTYYTSTLDADLVPVISGGVHAVADVELGIALDLANRDSFILANTQALEVHEDTYLHRSGFGGVYGHMGYGVGCLDGRRVLPFSF